MHLPITQTELAPLTPSQLVPLTMVELYPRTPSKITALKGLANRRTRSRAGTPVHAIRRKKAVIQRAATSEPATDEEGDEGDIDEEDQLDEDRSLDLPPLPAADTGKIQKPNGEAGRPNRGGYALDDTLLSLGWMEVELDALKVSIRHRIYCIYSLFVVFLAQADPSPAR